MLEIYYFGSSLVILLAITYVQNPNVLAVITVVAVLVMYCGFVTETYRA
jgi:hypothetical protein